MDAGDRPARLAVGVLGAGRVGSALGAALRAGRAPGRRRERRVRRLARWAAERLGVRRPGPTRWWPAADLVLLTVPDDALPGAGRGLARRAPILRAAAGAHQRAVRLGGARPGHARGRAAAGAAPGDDVHRHAPTTCPARRLTFGVTAPEALRPVAEALVDRDGRRAGLDRGGGPRRCTTRRSPAARTTWSRSSPSPWTCCARAGVEEPGRMLGPLLGAALDNALRLGDAALTGPVARGDAGTVAAHVAALIAGGPRGAPPPTSRWPGSPPTGRWRPGCSSRGRPSALLGRAGRQRDGRDRGGATQPGS